MTPFRRGFLLNEPTYPAYAVGTPVLCVPCGVPDESEVGTIVGPQTLCISELLTWIAPRVYAWMYQVRCGGQVQFYKHCCLKPLVPPSELDETEHTDLELADVL